MARGAEAVLYLDGQKGKRILVKERIKKGYRIRVLDESIRKGRTRREAKMLEKASRSGVPVPAVLELEREKIKMDFIDGKTVKDSFNEMPGKEQEWTSREIGSIAANLHRNGMVHGDLTTSNMILFRKKLYLIDFGLGKFSQKIEDQAVDLFLLYEALKAAHYKYLNKAWQNILKIYKQNYSKATQVLKRFENISVRRRYK